MGRVGFVLLILLICVSPVFALVHPDPYSQSEIQFSGAPHYLENLTVGSPISDFGSHYGLKLSATRDGIFEGSLSVYHFLNSAQYAAFTDFFGQLDQIYLYLRIEDYGYVFVPCETRTADFSCWGWQEAVTDGNYSATGWATTIATDSFLLYATTFAPQNSGRVKPHVVIHLDKDGLDESTVPLNFWAGYEFELNDQLLLVTYKRMGSSLYRTIKTNFNIENVYFRSNETEIVIEGSWLDWSEDWEKTFYTVIGAGLTVEEAVSNCENGAQIVEDGGPQDVIEANRERWEQIFSSLPTPHVSSGEEKFLQTYDMAACGLVMNMYSPRDAMTAWGAVPAKSHFNVFWGWDTAFQALGLSNFHTQMAKDAFTTLFSGPENRVYLELNDSLNPTWGMDLTQQPVQGKYLWDVFTRDGAQDREWLEFVYQGTKSYLNWWESKRDLDADGLYEWILTLETGWDDSPRYGCSKETNVCLKDLKGFEPIDLNSWLYEYYLYAAKMADFLGYEAEARNFRYKAQMLAIKIDSELYDSAFESYFDRKTVSEGGHELVRVFTPAIFLPLSVGLVKSPERAKRLIERYLLNPDHFWYGDQKFAVPTVAFGDPDFDSEQDGFYWQGQVWLVTNYLATLALWRYGYESEARELAKRTLEMIANADPGGIYETYDPKTGAIGFGIRGRVWSLVSEPSAFQFGWSCAFVIELLLERYQRERYLMPDDSELSGYLKEVKNISTGKNFYWVNDDSYEVPKSEIKSTSGKPLTFDPVEIELKLSDEFGNYNQDEAKICFGLKKREIFEKTDNGSRKSIKAELTDEASCFFAKLNKKYAIVRPETEHEKVDVGCGCSFYPQRSTSNRGDKMALTILFLLAFTLSVLMRSRNVKILSIVFLLFSICFVSCQGETDDRDDDTDDDADDDAIDDDSDWAHEDYKIDCTPGKEVPEPTGPIFPELTTHPRLFFELDDLEMLRARKERTPYKELYNFIVSTSNQTPDLSGGEYSASREHVNSNIATACAFRALLDDNEAMADKAKLILSNAATEFGPIDYALIDSDIHVAEAVEQFALAFDILAGSDYLDKSEYDDISEHLELLVANTYELFVKKMSVVREVWKNNHTTKLTSALSVAALVFNQNPQANKWFNYGLTKTHEVLDYQLTTEGVCAEGLYYYTYSAVNHMPFAVALYRLFGAKNGYYAARRCTLIGTGCHWECVFVPDLLTWDKMVGSFYARVKLRMPNGSSPLLDDAHPAGFFNGMVSSLLNDGVLAWDWMNTPIDPYCHRWCTIAAIVIYALFDADQPQTLPDFNPTIFFPGSGLAVFRTGWDVNDTYLLFLAESGDERIHGIAHEHADGLSFSLFSYGEFLALECGYIDYPNHDLVRNGIDHNLVLVDGEGPPSPHIILGIGGVDAFLDDFFDTDFLDTAYGRTSFGGASHGRRILFFEQPAPFFIVADHLLSSQTHDYTWILHGNGGGDSGGTFSFIDDGAIWERTNAYLQTVLSSTVGKPALSSRLEEHSPSWQQIRYHETLWANVNSQNAAFVSLLFPAETGTPYIDVITGFDADKKAGWLNFELDGKNFFAFVQESYFDFSGQIEGVNLTTSARTVVFTAPDKNSETIIFIEGKNLDIDGQAFVSAPENIVIGVKLISDEASGYVTPKGASYVDLWVGFSPNEVSGDGVKEWEYLGEGIVRLYLSGATAFQISEGD